MRYFASFTIGTTLLIGVSLLSATCRENEAMKKLPPAPPLPPAAAAADIGQRAYRHVTKLVGFGPRFTGSPGWQRGLDYIAAELERASGRSPVRDRWTDSEFGITFENISVTIPGKRPDRLLIACHHDTKKCEGHPDPEHNFPFVGANDSGSGAGLLLALAEELRDWDGEATLELVFFDGEECLDYKWDENKSLFGSRRVVAQERQRQVTPGNTSRIRALVLLDMVGAKDLQIDEEEYSDKTLRAIFRRAAAGCGHDKVFFQSSLPIKDDHLPFIRAGIPAIDLIDLIDNPQWHTEDDVLEHISPDSMQIVGEVVLTALPAIDAEYCPPSRIQLPERR